MTSIYKKTALLYALQASQSRENPTLLAIKKFFSFIVNDLVSW
ncbi:hypothetical protein [Brasilonema sp. UFV-L1]|nr:hypothetical protein [Brasilonema sp. UFV-L1]